MIPRRVGKVWVVQNSTQFAKHQCSLFLLCTLELAGSGLRYILAAKLKRMRRLDVGNGTHHRLGRCRVIRGCRETRTQSTVRLSVDVPDHCPWNVGNSRPVVTLTPMIDTYPWNFYAVCAAPMRGPGRANFAPAPTHRDHPWQCTPPRTRSNK
jgi:hypothetical protein